MGEAAEKLTQDKPEAPKPEAPKLAVVERLPSLYHLTAEVAAILDSDEEDAPGAAARLAELLPSIEHKVAAVAHFAQMSLDLAATLKTREQAFAKQRKSAEGKAAYWLAYLKGCMEAAEMLKVTDSRSGTTVALQLNPPSVKVTDEGAIPRRFWIVPEMPAPALDNRALLEALKAAKAAGAQIPGAELKQDCRVVIK